MSGTTGAGNDGERAARTEGRTDARIDTLLARLLDLSLRNRLLNFRPTKQSMQAASAGLAQACAIEDAVAKDGKWFRLQATDFPDDLARQLDQATADLQRGVLRMRAPANRCAADSIEIFRRAHRTLDILNARWSANYQTDVTGTLRQRVE